MAEEREATPPGAGDAAVDARDLDDALEQSLASREILLALGRERRQLRRRSSTPSSSAPRRLCRADAAQLSLLDGDVFRLSRTLRRRPRGVPPLHAGPPDRAQPGLARSAGSPRTGGPSRSPTCSATRSTAGRTSSASPASAPCWRRRCCWATRWWASSPCGAPQVAPFSERDTRLLDDFAAQAAIALRQVDLMRSLEARGAELASKVEQLEALRERGRGRQLEPRPGRGARPDRHQRRPAHRHRRRIDHGVRRGDRHLPGADRLRDAARLWSPSCAPSPSAATRPWSAGPPPSGTRSRSATSPRSTRPPPRGALPRRVAIGARHPHGARRPDRRRAGHPSAVGGCVPRGDGGPAARPSRPSRRSPS